MMLGKADGILAPAEHGTTAEAADGGRHAAVAIAPCRQRNSGILLAARHQVYASSRVNTCEAW